MMGIAMFAAAAAFCAQVPMAETPGFLMPCHDPAIAAIVTRAWEQADKADAQIPLNDDAKPGDPTYISPQREKDLENDVKEGEDACKEINKELKPTTHADLQARAERIGGLMAKLANETPTVALWGDHQFSRFNYHFMVVQSKNPDDVNAFTLPGGFVYVYEGLIRYVQSDDELAAVLGHEISHAKFRHFATLSREANKFNMVTLPLVIISLLANAEQGANVFLSQQLMTQAVGSGWSVDAEKAADYGSFQLLIKSPYNPTGLLTFMERLGHMEHSGPQFDWGIFTSHPPSKERAVLIASYMKKAGIPIRRSLVSTSCRVSVVPADGGKVALKFDDKTIFEMAGSDALDRADAAAEHLNAFLDTVPSLYEVQATSDGELTGNGQELFTLSPDDITACGMSKPDAIDAAVKGVRNAIYMLIFKIWDIS